MRRARAWRRKSGPGIATGVGERERKVRWRPRQTSSHLLPTVPPVSHPPASPCFPQRRSQPTCSSVRPSRSCEGGACWSAVNSLRSNAWACGQGIHVGSDTRLSAAGSCASFWPHDQAAGLMQSPCPRLAVHHCSIQALQRSPWVPPPPPPPPAPPALPEAPDTPSDVSATGSRGLRGPKGPA